MVELRTLRKCKWKDIEVGEVFAWDGCWIIGEKRSKRDSYRLLAVDGDCLLNEGGEIRTFCDISYLNLYKIPIAMQRLWKTE